MQKHSHLAHPSAYSPQPPAPPLPPPAPLLHAPPTSATLRALFPSDSRIVPNAQAQALIEGLGFTPRYFTRDGLSMHYLDEGQGEPLVMVHGNPSWCWLYRDLVAALKPDYRCVVPDHIGMGLSDKPDDGRYRYTLDSRVADFSAFMDKVVPSGPVTLIVHDWGGAIAGHGGFMDRLDSLSFATGIASFSSS